MGVFIPDGIEATTRRCDLASDVTFVTTEDSQTFLRGVSAVNLPRWKRVVTTAPGSSVLESLAWVTTGGIQLRLYDKTEETKRRKKGLVKRSIDLALRVVRLERQLRPKKEEQLCPAAFRAQDLAARFAGPLADAALGTVVAATLERLIDLWRNAEFSRGIESA